MSPSETTWREADAPLRRPVDQRVAIAPDCDSSASAPGAAPICAKLALSLAGGHDQRRAGIRADDPQQMRPRRVQHRLAQAVRRRSRRRSPPPSRPPRAPRSAMMPGTVAGGVAITARSGARRQRRRRARSRAGPSPRRCFGFTGQTGPSNPPLQDIAPAPRPRPSRRSEAPITATERGCRRAVEIADGHGRARFPMAPGTCPGRADPEARADKERRRAFSHEAAL